MADKSVSSTGTVHVEIFGQTYTVKAGADPGYVEELAAHVDAQMREVSRTAGAVDSVRVAVLAAPCWLVSKAVPCSVRDGLVTPEPTSSIRGSVVAPRCACLRDEEA